MDTPVQVNASGQLSSQEGIRSLDSLGRQRSSLARDRRHGRGQEDAILRSHLLVLVGLLMLSATAANAAITVNSTVTPLGGSFRYEFSITNSNVVSPDEDVPIVSITDAPLADALISATLTAPAGFNALYDPGLGIVDFVEGTSNFGVGTTTPGFSFESLTAPGPGVFSSFQALTVAGALSSGNVQQMVVQSPSTVTPTPTSTVGPTPTPTLTPTSTSTLNPTPTPTATSMMQPMPTATPTVMSGAAPTDAIPTLDWRGFALLIGLVLFSGLISLRRLKL